MEDSVDKEYVVCKTEKSIENFYRNCSECIACNIERVLERYYNNKDEIMQQRRDKYARFKDLDNGLKALEEGLSVHDLTT